MCHYFIVAGETDYSRFKNEYDAALTDKKILSGIISRSLAIKKSYIEIDEFDRNERQVFNYGHSFGHAIESLSNYVIPHGQAVVLGMMIINELSYQTSLLSENEKDNLNQLCSELLNNEILHIMSNMDIDLILDVLQKDKKVAGSDISFVMLKTMGELRFIKMKLEQSLVEQIREAVASVVPAKAH